MLLTQERPQLATDLDSSMVNYHNEFVQQALNDLLERKYNWFQQKHYIEHVLSYLLKTKKYNLVTEFLDTELALTVLTMGLLQKVDFSDYILAPVIDTKEKDDAIKQAKRVTYILFINAHMFTLNEKASKALLFWAHRGMLNESYSEKLLWTSFQTTPATLTYGKEYDLFVKQWVKSVKTRTFLKHIKSEAEDLANNITSKSGFLPKKSRFGTVFPFQIHYRPSLFGRIKSIFFSRNLDLAHNLKTLQLWGKRTEPNFVKDTDITWLYQQFMHTNRNNLYNVKSEYLAWAFELLYKYVDTTEIPQLYNQNLNSLLMVAYNLNTKPETRIKAKKLLNHTRTNNATSYDFEKALKNTLETGLITELDELYEDFPELTDNIIEISIDTWLPIPPKYLGRVCELDWEKYIIPHDGLPDLYKSYIYLKEKPNLPDFLNYTKEETVLTNLLNEMGIERTENMPDSSLLSIFKTMIT